jgi:hypothetical protein
VRGLLLLLLLLLLTSLISLDAGRFYVTRWVAGESDRSGGGGAQSVLYSAFGGLHSTLLYTAPDPVPARSGRRGKARTRCSEEDEAGARRDAELGMCDDIVG